MVIPASTLPSKGLTTMVTNVTINPMTYQEIIEYSKWSPDNKVDRLIHNIETILSGIPQYEQLSAYDVKMLIFTRKWVSATFNETIKINMDNFVYHINVADISFKDIDQTDLLNIQSVTLKSGTYPFVIPSIQQYVKTMRFLQNRKIPTDPETALLIAALDTMNDTDRVAYVVNNAEGSEITALRSLADQLCNSVNDVTISAQKLNPLPMTGRITGRSYSGEDDEKGKEVTVVDINENITDIFQFLRINSESSISAIINKKEVGNRHPDNDSAGDRGLNIPN